MAIPKLTPMPDPPLPTDAEAVFDEKAGIYLTAEQNLVNVDLNGKLIPGINAAVEQIEADKLASAASAAAAKASADAAGSVETDVSEQIARAEAAANNATASAAAAESAPGSIGNLALLHAVALSF